jgi:hypothetical protein
VSATDDREGPTGAPVSTAGERLTPALERLEALLREQGGLMAGLLPAAPDAGTDPGARHNGGAAARTAGTAASALTASAPIANGAGPAQLAASGPRAREHAAEYELLLEAIYEGYLLHYGCPRLLRPPDADLGLLAGDQLYALGLARLVELGDLMAVAELADVITLTALAQGVNRAELAHAIWMAGARTVGWGPSETHRRAKALARAGDPEALAAMRAAAEPDGR